jgi:hypothetical protein
VQIKQGENLIVSTSANLKAHQVKVTNIQGEFLGLAPLQKNIWSLQGLTPGVYILDVIVDMSSSGIMGAYETALVILQPDQQPLPPAQYVNQITTTVKTDVRIIFRNDTRPPIPVPPGLKPPSPCYFDPTLPECQPVDGKCPPGFGFNDNDQCIPIGKCPDGYGRLDDDETGKCYKNSDIKTCPDGYITHKNEKCPKPSPTPTPTPTDYCVPYLMSPEQYAAECTSGPGLVPRPTPPICTDETPEGQVCRNEGDLLSDPDEVPPSEDNEGPPSTGDDVGGNDEAGDDDKSEEGGGSDDNNGGEENVPQFGN